MRYMADFTENQLRMHQQVMRYCAEEKFFKSPTIDFFLNAEHHIHGIIWDERQFLFRFWPAGGKDASLAFLPKSFPPDGVQISAPELEELEACAKTLGMTPMMIFATKENIGGLSSPYTKGEKLAFDMVRIAGDKIRWLT